MRQAQHNATRSVLTIVLMALLGLLAGACGQGIDPVGIGPDQDLGMVDRENLENPAAVGADDVYANLGTVNPPLTSSDSKLAGSEDMTYDEFVQAVGINVNGMWQALFENSGYTYSNAEVLLYEDPIGTTGCVQVADPEMGPFYCPVNQVVHYPLTWTDPASGQNPAQIGDFAVATIVAHEIGHHVENQLGELDDPGTYSIQIELRADCLAGIWARSTYEQGILESGDIGEAMELTANVADLPGTDPTDPRAHGTERQRTDAFLTGYETGDPNECRY